ncbi:protein EMBRYONIC FLOWER 1 isoform X2 [Asparagus officinalis]|nr:protein EMBRYONIC FLOWER 1 isoform X2 [Asparagus officinalis]
MEASLLTRPSDIAEQPTLVYNYSHSPITSIAEELVLSQRESTNCEHFTIRSYVSEVRKRNAKICWPFSMVNHTDKEINILPPLHVERFRQWDCQSCLPKTIAHEAILKSGAKISNLDGKGKDGHIRLLRDATMASHRATKRSLVISTEKSEENCFRVSSGEGRPLLCRGKKCDECPTSNFIKGGDRIAKDGCNRPKENKDLMSKPEVVSEGQETYEKREKEGNVMVRANNSDIALLSPDTPNIWSCRRDRTALAHRTGGKGTCKKIFTSLSFRAPVSDKEQDQGLRRLGKRKQADSLVTKAQRTSMLGVDIETPGDGSPPAQLTLLSHDSEDLDEFGDEASDTSTQLIKNVLHNQGDARKEKSQPRKIRKMRTLDDIMKSVEIVHDEKNCTSSKNVDASGGDSIQSPDASAQTENPNHACYLSQNSGATEIKRKTTKEAVPNDSEGTCLIQWLKKASKKGGSHRGVQGDEHVNVAVSPSKSSTVKDLDLNLEYSGKEENKQEIIWKKKQNLMPAMEVQKPSSMPKEDSMTHKDHFIMEKLLDKSFHFKPTGIMISEKFQHRKLETQESNHKKFQLKNKKNKRPLFEDRDQQCFKDSWGVQKQSVSKLHREVKKKQRIMKISNQESAEDIPMDIVELLAKKQQERRLSKTKYDSLNTSKSPKTTGAMKDNNVSVDTTEALKGKVSDSTHRCLNQEEPQSNTAHGASTSGRIDGDAECRSRDAHSCSGTKQYHHFDLNQEAPACTSQELQTPSPYIGLSMSGAQLSIVDAPRNHSPQNLSTNGTWMLPFCSTASPQYFFSNAHDRSCQLLHGYSQINSVGHNAGYQPLVNPIKEKCDPSLGRGVWAAKSFAEPGNVYYSNMMGPVDFNKNETISSLNLLKLVQQSACSGETPHFSGYSNDMGYIQAFNAHGREFLGPKVDVRHSYMPLLDEQARNICKPLRPHPRIGVLGPQLQKEITNTSNNITPTLGFGARNPSEVTFHKTSFTATWSNAQTSHKTTEKGKAEAINCQTSLSRYVGSEMIGSTNVSLEDPGCSLENDTIGKAGAFQPLRNSLKMEECVLNRNPADFAMPDEDSEYMIGYEERKKDQPLCESQQPLIHLQIKKGQKMRNLNDLNR